MAQRNNRRKNAQSPDGYIPASGQRSSARNAGAHRSPAYHATNQETVRPVSQSSYARKGSVRSIDPRSAASREKKSRLQPAYSQSYPGSSDQYSRYTSDYSNRQTGMSRGKKVLTGFLIALLAVAVLGLGVFVYKEYQKDVLNRGLHDNMSKEDLLAIDAELTGMSKFDEPFTILLLGSDARSNDPSMGARTDTIVLVRVDPLTNNIALLSIPRDTRVNIPNVGYEKLNAAYSYGGAKGVITAVKDLCDIEIDHYAEIDFEGLVGLIDAIGGIDVMVDETINDPDAGSIIIPEGEQHLDGEAALVFSRSRAYADGDYTRVSNQRKVIEAIIYRGLEAPSNELYGLIRQSVDFLTTDSAMTIDFIFSLADQMRHNNDYPITITTATLPSYAQYINNVSYVIADPQGVKEIIKLFLNGEDIAAFMEDYTPTGSGEVSLSGGTSVGNTYGYTYDPGYSNSSDYSYGGGGANGYGNDVGTGYDPGYGNGGAVGNDTEYETGTNVGSDAG